MTCIRHNHAAAAINMHAQASDKASVMRFAHLPVEPAQKFGRRHVLPRQCTQCTNGQRPRHRRLQSLPAYIPNRNQRAAASLFDHLVEVARNLLRRKVGGLDAQSGQRGKQCGN